MEERFELGACALTEVTGKLRKILYILTGNTELDTTSMLYLSPFKKGVDINNAFAVIVNAYLKIGVFCIVAADNALPGFHVSVMKQLIAYNNGYQRNILMGPATAGAGAGAGVEAAGAEATEVVVVET